MPTGEGCLSVPNLWHDALRHPYARVEGIDLAGEELVLEGEGLFAQMLQHETDHLDGVVYLQRLTRERARRRDARRPRVRLVLTRIGRLRRQRRETFVVSVGSP